VDYEIRYATADEYPQVVDLDGANFGIGYSEQDREDAKLDLDLDRLLIAADGPRVVGVSAELAFELTVPGGAPVPVTGLTWVSVEVTDRRRGVLRSLIERQVQTAAGDGQAALVLTASEGGIYGRYGFGVASWMTRCVVDRRRARMAEAVDPGRVRRLSTEQARELLPALHERWRRTSPGAVNRDERRWQLMLLDRDSQRGGRSALQHLVHPDGYLSYRTKVNWGQPDPAGECEIVDYAPVTPQAHAELWQTLLGLDLIRTISSYKVPLDDPLPLLLTDPRSVDTTHVGDGLWVRPTDVATLLGRRRYGLEIDCVIGVRDPLLGDGHYRLRGGPDGAECGPTDDPADVDLAVAEVGALSLGGVRLRRLARVGLVDWADDTLLHRLDLALLADRAPAHGTQF
jgi:predicted acetyltransferase